MARPERTHEEEGLETETDFRFLKAGPAGPADNSGLRLRIKGRPRLEAGPVEAELRRIAQQRLAQRSTKRR